MAKIRRVIRRVKQDLPPSFDEQLWPVNVAIFVLAAFCSGLLFATCNFVDTPFASNGWTYVSLTWFVAISVMLLAWGFSRRFARRMQLSGVLAIILVLMIGIAMRYVPLNYSVQIAEGPTDGEPRPDQRVAEEHIYLDLEQQEDPRLEHEKPVDVKPPDEDTVELQKSEQDEEQELKKEEETEPVEQIEPQVEPNQIERQQTAKSVPKAADSPSKLSKQTQPTDAARPNKVAAPQVTAAKEPAPKSTLEANSESVQRQQSKTSIQRASTDPTPRTEREQPTVQMARKPTPRASQPTPSAAATTLTKAVDQPTQKPTTAKVSAPAIAKSSNAEPAELKPSIAVNRAAAASTNVSKQQVDTKVAASTEVAKPSQPRQQPSPTQPVLAQTSRPSPSRSPQALETPTDTQAVAAQVAAAPAEQPAAETSLNPTTDAVARSAPSAATEAPTRPQSGEVASDTVTNAVAESRPTRSVDSSQPSVTPNAPAADVAKRSAVTAEAPASPVAVDSPAVATSSNPSPNASEPRELAISKSIRGTSGAGQSPNFDRGLPAKQSDSFVANAAARRAEATTKTPAEAGLSISEAASVAKDRAMANSPSTVAQADAVEVATETGSRQTSDVNATASAATKQSTAKATVGQVTADAGKTEIDTGPTQTMANRGTGRAAGGGQPAISLSSTTSPASRTAESGGAAAASLNTAAIGPTPVDIAAATGGGRPPAPEANSQATAATRQATGAGSQPSVDRIANTEPTAGPAGGGAPNVAAVEAARSSTTEALPGAVAGGGTDQPAKATGVGFTAQIAANAPELKSVPGGIGDPEALNQLAVAAEGVARDDGRQGEPGPAIEAPTGAAQDEIAMNVPVSTTIGKFAGERSTAEGGEPGPEVARDAGGAPIKETGEANIPGVARVDAEPIEFGDGGAAGGEPTEQLALGDGAGELDQRETGGVQVTIKAEFGDGGLGLIEADAVGNISRKAQRDSQVVNITTDTRFQQKDVGGPIATNTKARAGEGAFEDRKKGEQGEGAAGLSPLALEETIVSGLEFLRKHQSSDGSWSFNNFGGGRPGYETETAKIQSDSAATGLALLSFLGAGYDHFDGRDQYPDVVKRGLEFLVANQQKDGCLYVDQDPYSSRSARLYSHAIATTALCEAYGMTGDKKLREPAQKAIEYIINTQHKDRGGWRYSPQVSSDTSVTGWMFAAVKSGDLAGLDVPEQVYANVNKWLDLAQVSRSDGSRYVYNPFAPNNTEQRHGREVTPAMTSLGLLLRLYQGWDRDKTDVVRGAEYVISHLPNDPDEQPDTYYWYYASQIMYHMKGDYWTKWERALYPQLRRTQVQDGPMAGSWSPGRDKWGEYGGRIYVTTLNLLSLEVGYRHLPLYEETGR